MTTCRNIPHGAGDAESARYIAGVDLELTTDREAMSEVRAQYPEQKVNFTNNGFLHMTISWARPLRWR